MRIPLPVVLLFCACVSAAAWWFGTRNHDFISLPSRARLEAVRVETIQNLSPPPSALPQDIESPSLSKDPPSAFADLPPPKTESFDTRNQRAATIQEYRDESKKGAEFLISTAVLLETTKDYQRALLAWERVIDSTKPTTNQLASAMSSMLRLRQTVPPWPDTAFHQRKVIVRADTAPKYADTLRPMLEALCTELSDAAAGIVKFEPDIRLTSNPKSKRTIPPVSLSFTGSQPESQRTPPIKFTPTKPESLLSDLRRNAYSSIRDLLSKENEVIPPTAWPKQESAAEIAFRSRITRLHWLTFGVMIQRPVTSTDAPSSPPTRKKTR